MDVIDALEAKIAKVEKDIEAVEGQIATCTDKETLVYLRDEKKQLRDKEKQLRDEKKRLLEQQHERERFLQEKELILLRNAAATTVLPPDPSSELPFYYQRFLKLLSLGKITTPNPNVLAVIERRCPYRLMVVPDCNAAVDLYREAQLFPGPSTEGHLLTQLGLRVNGPLFPNPADGPANLLVGATDDGSPVVVKLLRGVGAAGAQQPGGSEAEACRVLMESKPAAVPLVPVRIVTFEIGIDHVSVVGRAPGLYAALCMPRYVSSLTSMVPLPAAAVLAGGRRMVAALEWIHGKKYIHMDVKADNIFVDAEGRWWLGDFGSAVRKGSLVTSTTACFAPRKVLDLPAEPQYDWHMLAVALVCEMNRKNWKELLVEDGCSPSKNLIAAVKELHGRDGCAELARFLNDELLTRAGCSAALP
ncbi:hypothetical protein Vretimale_670 [Volvox reticuliferus]|uniref:Protein kinase domain-containing protein n=1 Tax=Volvox reticuliferus TaxID=1737510 RepID=A0A8J4C2A4_9CHLO|nr:hypothetical protein Vretifemale_2315 [Volvox reticuliferus]GIL94494.1 hypothetical protein Vretimale_670 [Volvox reticuliferus]GIL94496.1 hypothetical protein Vretimale_670 [Volvox reticuliferus]